MCVNQGSMKETEPLEDSNQNHGGKGILGNVVHLSQGDTLQATTPCYLTALRM